MADIGIERRKATPNLSATSRFARTIDAADRVFGPYEDECVAPSFRHGDLSLSAMRPCGRKGKSSQCQLRPDHGVSGQNPSPTIPKIPTSG